MFAMDRRSFLKRFFGSVILLVSGGLGARRAGAAKNTASEEAWFRIGKLDEFAEGNPTEIKKAHDVGGMKASGDPKLIAIRRGNQVHVMSLACTHKGCKVELQKDGGYRCPCHGALFDAAGQALKGPAKTALPWYDTKVMENGEVRVNTARPVAAP